MQTLVVATSNPGKVEEMQAYLDGLAWHLQLKPPQLEIEETGKTFAENACLKATQVARALGMWAIADDSGLEVAVLGGAPGLHSARYGKTDAERIARLLKALGDRSERAAQFACAIALARPDGTVALQAMGICPGTILDAPRGTGGFGYDPIFYVPEAGRTFAEMSPEQKHSLSHRGRAFAELLPQLAALSAAPL
ncbi:non-canonical purine NTP pyrophosphatase, rdgB/HAM1 family [Rubidibacter lacunae KORDI 51-2]|uniref:dITP/XTP pyrophosphatase n=1 Tax=Rubidibacter lacunae KORDI 51-2 TaxID=582515 RepID=U5DHT2_9CHRO|nr:RdgB/HAM1 family non-canonical purine NTP pyrophosphatase [Rubidibacter lacunae]ERN41206.1 non-canonical purine NTP pyrophosphatase, rdgB/HAM1 family [Rubidibacter lacunae KORDI 51-2]